jgi:excisionase family DNA binding protein
MSEKQRFLTISEAAEVLHVSEISLRRWTNSGKLRCFRVGGRNERRFMIDDLLAFMPAMDVQSEVAHKVETENSVDADNSEHHVSLFFRTIDEQWQLLRPYILDHLQAGEPVIYLQHSTSSERLMERLRAEGLSLHHLIGSGLLRVLPPAQSYLLSGRFEAQAMLDFIETTIVAGLERGYKRVLMTGEMTWSLADAPGADQLMRYEELLNPLVDRYPAVTIVCQYDLRRFDGVAILDALLTHPSILIASGHAAGFYGV